MILKAISTGRGWGDKCPPKEQRVTVHGCKVVISECDAWDGPVSVDDKGEYVRLISIKSLERTSPWAIRHDKEEGFGG